MMITGIIGSGTMGKGIAQVAATFGHKVVLTDSNASALEKAKADIGSTLARLTEKGKITQEEAGAVEGRIGYSTDTQDLGDCGIVIEAIVENLEIKRKLFSALEGIVAHDCILGTNTSSLSIASIAGALKNPERFLGIHFFNPVPLMPLVEIIPSFITSPAVTERSRSLIDSWKKLTVLAKDTPGFIVNRIARPYYGEAMRIYEEGIADIATIDHAMREKSGFRMGPFELTDFIGHDVNYVVTETVWTQFYYDPRFKPALCQKRLLEAGFLGRKSGRGFYDYREGAESPEPDTSDTVTEEIFIRILSMLVNEAYDALYMQVATKEDIETAMTKGLNYPKGLFQWGEEIGLGKIYAKLKGLQEIYGEDRYRPNVLLRKESGN